jgi:uncharacterized protein YcbX/ferredoxin
MNKPHLKNISIYPIKSSAAIELSTSWVEELGLAFDRRFVVANMAGHFFTARTHPTLCLIQSNLTAHGLMLNAPDMPSLQVNYHDLMANYQNVSVWDDTIKSQQSAEHINQWFSAYLKQDCQLLFFGEHSQRFVKNKMSQVGFADGYPLLLISRASLNELNNRLIDKTTPVPMAQFRPNLVVDDCDAFAEDNWQHIRIGEVEFELTKPCSRCIFTTINAETAEEHPRQEPLATLKQFRQNEKGDVLFGQNLVALNEGRISQGDKIEIIQRKASPIFHVPVATEKKPAAPEKANLITKKKPYITFSSHDKKIVGNNQETVLEQGEDAGLLLPYSCRAGMCGRCKVQLVSGDVEQSCQDGLSEQELSQGYILACCSTPVNDIVVNHPQRKSRRSEQSD